MESRPLPGAGNALERLQGGFIQDGVMPNIWLSIPPEMAPGVAGLQLPGGAAGLDEAGAYSLCVLQWLGIRSWETWNY